jgi:hypothetical protein
MFYPHLPRQLGAKFTYKPRVPEFARDAQIFAAAHQGVGFAAFGRSGDAVWVEVLLLTAGYRDKSVVDELVLCLVNVRGV